MVRLEISWGQQFQVTVMIDIECRGYDGRRWGRAIEVTKQRARRMCT